jgi:hypothetical protein
MSTKKAQVWTTDFALSMLIFVVALVLFGRAVMNLSTVTGEKIDNLVSDGRLITDSLTSQGYPSNWTAADVKKIGLINEGKTIDMNKLNMMANMSYDQTKKLFGLKYDYFIFFIGEDGKLANITPRLGIGHPSVYAIGTRRDTNNIAYYQKENLLLNEMQDLNATVYTGGSLASFLNDMNNYELLVMEDPHFSETNIRKVEDYVREGGKLIITEHISDTSGTYFGVNFVHRSMNAENQLATVSEEDSNMGFAKGENYTPREYPYVEAGHITVLSEYPDWKPAMAVFGYGSGKVYYFSDIDNPDYSGDFEGEVKEGAQKFLQEYRPENYVELNQVEYTKLVTITRLVVLDQKITRMILYIWD